ncbi:MAG: HugZ family protein [Xanthobacter sp.]
MSKPAAVVRWLIHEARFGSLATLDETGAPYASMVAVGTDPAGLPTLLISKLALHTQFLAHDGRVTLLVATLSAPDPMNAARASLRGKAELVDDPQVRERFLARHEDAARYVDFPDFAFYRVEIESAHLVEGFGRIIDVNGKDLRTDWTGAEALAEATAGIISHMNEDHADAVALYATRLAGAEDGAWKLISLDPEGFEIAAGRSVHRIAFPERATTAMAVRKGLVALAEQARRTDAA